jgi:hypothetical protein
MAEGAFECVERGCLRRRQATNAVRCEYCGMPTKTREAAAAHREAERSARERAGTSPVTTSISAPVSEQPTSSTRLADRINQARSGSSANATAPPALGAASQPSDSRTRGGLWRWLGWYFREHGFPLAGGFFAVVTFNDTTGLPFLFAVLAGVAAGTVVKYSLPRERERSRTSEEPFSRRWWRTFWQAAVGLLVLALLLFLVFAIIGALLLAGLISSLR